MAKKQKNASPSREQASHMRAAGLDHRFWVVIKDLESSMIVKQRFTEETRLIRKKFEQKAGRRL